MASDDNQSDDNQYGFEKKQNELAVRTREKAKPEAAKLIRRLGLQVDDIDETIKRALEDFVINHHLAIEYYQKQTRQHCQVAQNIHRRKYGASLDSSSVRGIHQRGFWRE